jgi:uncharacterized protein (TIGR02246 family)
MTGLAAAPPRDVAAAPGWAVLDRFLAAFTAADPERILDLFWPDALVWGTTMPALATGPAAVRAYFAAIGGRRPGERRACWAEGDALVPSGATILLSGTWSVGPGAGAGPVLTLRLSLAVVRRGAAWRILQFHSSPAPAPSVPAR